MQLYAGVDSPTREPTAPQQDVPCGFTAGRQGPGRYQRAWCYRPGTRSTSRLLGCSLADSADREDHIDGATAFRRTFRGAEQQQGWRDGTSDQWSCPVSITVVKPTPPLFDEADSRLPLTGDRASATIFSHRRKGDRSTARCSSQAQRQALAEVPRV